MTGYYGTLRETANHTTEKEEFEHGEGAIDGGQILDIHNKRNEHIGYLVLRSPDSSSGSSLELFDINWNRAWSMPDFRYHTQSFESADNYELYNISLNNENFMIVSINVSSPINVYATNCTNNGTFYGRAVRLYNYDGTSYLGAAELQVSYVKCR